MLPTGEKHLTKATMHLTYPWRSTYQHRYVIPYAYVCVRGMRVSGWESAVRRPDVMKTELTDR